MSSSVLPTPTSVTTGRRVVSGLALVGLAVTAVYLLVSRAGTIPVPMDYLEYWASGQLCVAGENPYDPTRLREVQEQTGLHVDMAVMMWNPPWTLALVIPFGLLPVNSGLLLWLAIHLGLVLTSADLLWRSFGGEPRLRWVSWLLAVGFAPTIFLLGSGQITAVPLFGLAGYLAAKRAGRPGLAGMAAALTAVKPHLLALFGLALLLDAVRSRSGRVVVLAGGAALAAATLMTMALHPPVLTEYLKTVLAPSSADHRGLADWSHPTLGYHLRALVAPRSFAAQVIPLAVAATGLVVVWWRHRRTWSMVAAVPLLTLGSMLAAPYGAWSFDLVLLLVPVLAAAAKLATPRTHRRTWVLAGVWFAVVSGILFACLLQTPKVPELTYVWVTPVVATGMWVFRPTRGRTLFDSVQPMKVTP
jgi:hypothetical protein